MSFGQSFQITPIQLITTVSLPSSTGEAWITPHFGVKAVSADRDGRCSRFTYPVKEHIVSEETSATMRYILEKVVAEGSGKRAAHSRIPHRRQDCHIGEAAQKRRTQYISSFVGFAPADDPQVMALMVPSTNRRVSTTGEPSRPRLLRDIFENIIALSRELRKPRQWSMIPIKRLILLDVCRHIRIDN